MESNFSLELNLGFWPKEDLLLHNPRLALQPATLKKVLLATRIAKLFHLLPIKGWVSAEILATGHTLGTKTADCSLLSFTTRLQTHVRTTGLREKKDEGIYSTTKSFNSKNDMKLREACLSSAHLSKQRWEESECQSNIHSIKRLKKLKAEDDKAMPLTVFGRPCFTVIRNGLVTQGFS